MIKVGSYVMVKLRDGESSPFHGWADPNKDLRSIGKVINMDERSEVRGRVDVRFAHHDRFAAEIEELYEVDPNKHFMYKCNVIKGEDVRIISCSENGTLLYVNKEILLDNEERINEKSCDITVTVSHEVEVIPYKNQEEELDVDKKFDPFVFGKYIRAPRP
jgi:hypothetical protein